MKSFMFSKLLKIGNEFLKSSCPKDMAKFVLEHRHEGLTLDLQYPHRQIAQRASVTAELGSRQVDLWGLLTHQYS